MSDDRSKSILMQVAFKAAASTGVGDVTEKTREFYSTLLTLHDEFGISLMQSNSGSGGGKREPKPLPEYAFTFELDGVTWIDYRTAKAEGTVKSTHPDFKTRGVTPQESVWELDKSGSPKDEAADLITAGNVARPF